MDNALAMAMSPWQWLVLILVVLLLFGGSRISDLMKSLGSGMRDFKRGMSEDEDEGSAKGSQGKSGK